MDRLQGSLVQAAIKRLVREFKSKVRVSRLHAVTTLSTTLVLIARRLVIEGNFLYTFALSIHICTTGFRPLLCLLFCMVLFGFRD